MNVKTIKVHAYNVWKNAQYMGISPRQSKGPGTGVAKGVVLIIMFSFFRMFCFHFDLKVT